MVDIARPNRPNDLIFGIGQILDLHLLRKPIFASIAHEWLLKVDNNEFPSRKALRMHAPGGENRCARIEGEVKAVVDLVARQYK